MAKRSIILSLFIVLKLVIPYFAIDAGYVCIFYLILHLVFKECETGHTSETNYRLIIIRKQKGFGIH